MDENWKRSLKRKQLEKHIAGLAHQKSREDRRLLKEKARRRRAAGEKRRPRNRGWVEDAAGGAEGFERMRSSEPCLGRGPRAAPASPARGESGAHHESEGPDALVVRVDRGRARLRLTDGDERDAPLAPALRDTVSGGIAVGDEVGLDEHGRVAAVAPRRGVLVRPDPGDRRRMRIVVANVDVVCVVASVARPATRPGLVDRLLVAAARGGAAPAVVASKVDLLDSSGRLALAERLAAYRAAALDCFAVSAASGEGVPALAAHLERRTAVLVGHSGVGKSSLLNALDPDAAQATAAVRGSDGRGRHTTTAALLRELPGGGRLIDTPGVREFGLGEVRREELDAAFPDVASHAASCRFDDCVHGPEPGCAVRAAVAAGELSAARLSAWRRILLDP